MPIIEGQALASGSSAGSSGVLVRGIRGPDLLGMEKISGTVEDGGGLLDFDNSGGVAIGTGLAHIARAQRRRQAHADQPARRGHADRHARRG